MKRRILNTTKRHSQRFYVMWSSYDGGKVLGIRKGLRTKYGGEKWF